MTSNKTVYYFGYGANMSKEYLENRICVGMGGRIAEELLNGKNRVTTGAQNDF